MPPLLAGLGDEGNAGGGGGGFISRPALTLVCLFGGRWRGFRASFRFRSFSLCQGVSCVCFRFCVCGFGAWVAAGGFWGVVRRSVVSGVAGVGVGQSLSCGASRVAGGCHSAVPFLAVGCGAGRVGRAVVSGVG